MFGKKYSIPNDDIIVESFNSRVFYRRKSTMNLPTFCLYGIKYDLFDIKLQKGNQTVSGRIPGKYFRAFSSIEEINNENISEKEKLSVVYISNYNLLKERIISKLKKMGISEEEIITEPINYYDTEVYGDNYWYEISSDKPKELLWKRKEFENQSEIRIIVNSKNEAAMNILRNEVIEIGDLTDIAQLMTADFNEGLYIKMTMEIGEKDDIF